MLARALARPRLLLLVGPGASLTSQQTNRGLTDRMLSAKRCCDLFVTYAKPGHVLWANHPAHHDRALPILGAMDTCLSPSATMLCTYWPYDMSYNSCANNAKLQRNWLRTSTLGCQQPANDWRLRVCGVTGSSAARGRHISMTPPYTVRPTKGSSCSSWA